MLRSSSIGILYVSSFLQSSSFPSATHCSRFISSTVSTESWYDKVKGVITGNKESSEAFTLLSFADQLSQARKLGSFKNYIVGRSGNATFADSFQKMETILRQLGKIDPNGEKLQVTEKQEVATVCNCSIAEVESALAKFSWAKEAEKKIKKLKAEGKPIPSNMSEIQKLMGSTPLELARSNLAKSGQISRNAPCPCGSKKRYKWCCGQDSKVK